VQLSAVLPRPRHLPHPRVPVRLLAALALAIVTAAAWMWLRDSSLVAVRDVAVTGVSSSQGAEVRAALTAAADDMTTLHVREDDLREAVRRFSSVAGLRVETDFPHTLRIEVVERRPVAVVTLGSQVIAVGAGGRLMRGVRPTSPLPSVTATRIAPGDRLSDPAALTAIGVLAQAPLPLRRRVSRAYRGKQGLTLDLRQGPQLIFGDASDAAAKWQAAARVLAEPSAQGAVYLDVRVPGRVAAGGLGTAPEPETDPLALTPQATSPNPQPQPENTPSLNP
jgi:cell division protein FtsQ